MQYSGGVSVWHAQAWAEILVLQEKSEILCGQRHPSVVDRGEWNTGISESFFVLIVAMGLGK